MKIWVNASFQLTHYYCLVFALLYLYITDKKELEIVKNFSSSISVFES